MKPNWKNSALYAKMHGYPEQPRQSDSFLMDESGADLAEVSVTRRITKSLAFPKRLLDGHHTASPTDHLADLGHKFKKKVQATQGKFKPQSPTIRTGTRVYWNEVIIKTFLTQDIFKISQDMSIFVTETSAWESDGCAHGTLGHSHQPVAIRKENLPNRQSARRHALASDELDDKAKRFVDTLYRLNPTARITIDRHVTGGFIIEDQDLRMSAVVKEDGPRFYSGGTTFDANDRSRARVFLYAYLLGWNSFASVHQYLESRENKPSPKTKGIEDTMKDCIALKGHQDIGESLNLHDLSVLFPFYPVSSETWQHIHQVNRPFGGYRGLSC